MSAQQIEFQLPAEAHAQAVTAWGLKDRLIKVVVDQLQKYKTGGLKLPPKDQFMAAAKAAFEKYVVAFDIPGIGEVIENIVDETMEAGFLRFVSVLYDKFAA